MAYAIFDGTGSYRIGRYNLLPGANPIDDDDVEVLKHLREEAPEWITLQDDKVVRQPEVEPEPEPDSEEAKEAYEKFQGRDGKWYFYRQGGDGEAVVQSDEYDDEDAVDAAIQQAIEEDLAEKKPEEHPEPSELSNEAEAGVLKAEDFAGGFKCDIEGCETADKVYKSKGALTNHQRIKHPDAFDAAKKQAEKSEDD